MISIVTPPISFQPQPTADLSNPTNKQPLNTQASPPSTDQIPTDSAPDKSPQKKLPVSSEAAAAQSTLKNAVLNSRQPDLNSPKASATPRSDISAQRAPQEGADEARALYNALYPQPKPTPAIPVSGVDEPGGADFLQQRLDAMDRRIAAQANPTGDSLLAAKLSTAMLKLKEGDLRTPLPILDIPKESTLGKWLEHTNNAFMNKALASWAKENNLDPRSLSYDSGKQELYGKTPDNQVKTFTRKERPAEDSLHGLAFEPLDAISKIMDPSGHGMLFSIAPTDKAPLAYVQQFYGLNVNNNNLSSINLVAEDISENESFPQTPASPGRSDGALLNEQNRIAWINDDFDAREKALKHAQIGKRIAAQTNPVGDSQLATALSTAMSGLTESDLSKPLPMVDIPKDSTFGKWMEQTNRAFMNKALVNWAEENNLDPQSLSYDSAKGEFSGRTPGNEVKTFTQGERPSVYSLHALAFDPVEELSTIMDPSGRGVMLSIAPTDKAPLDRVQRFYGLDVNNNDLPSIHQVAKEIAENKSFPPTPGSPDRGDEALLDAQDSIAQVDRRFANGQKVRGNPTLIEVSASGSAFMETDAT